MDAETQRTLDDLESRIQYLESQRINQQQILPNAVTQAHIRGGVIIFVDSAANRPADGSTQVQAFFSNDTHVLSIWDKTAKQWRTVTLS
jgi:hypothetical protein